MAEVEDCKGEPPSYSQPPVFPSVVGDSSNAVRELLALRYPEDCASMTCGETPPAMVGNSNSTLKLNASQTCEEVLSSKILEVRCKSCGKVRRFAYGTDAGFAVYLINRKLGFGVPPALYIEAVKEGEEPISFGPKATLVSYGEGWELQTVIIEGDYEATSQHQQICKIPTGSSSPGNSSALGSNGRTSYIYFIKVLVAFALMLLLCVVLVYILEKLPCLIQFVTS